MHPRTLRINYSDKVINSLIETEFIYTSTVEKVLRVVNSKLFACNLRSTLFNFVSPCVTSTVLECLEMRPGLKLLNIGSENGYFSTMAGLLLGSTGVNHGIEIDQSLVNIANQKIDNFKLNSTAIDHYVFCEPVFMHGNACELLSTNYYDRVYCRPGVPQEQIEFMKSLIKIGGMLVMPLDKTLVRITRIDELTFDTIELIKVSRTELIVPKKLNKQKIKFPTVEPLALKELCRTAIRSLFHENIVKEFPHMDIYTKCKIVSCPEKKMFGLRDPLSECMRAQYDLSEEQIFYLRFPLDTFDELGSTYNSDSISESSSMLHGESDDDDTSDDDNNSTDDNSFDNNDNLNDTENLDSDAIQHHNDKKINNDDKLKEEEKYNNKLNDGEKLNKIDIDKKVDCSKDMKKKDKITVPPSNESAKRKSSEAECSQCTSETENLKRTKIDSSSQKSTSAQSTSPVLIHTNNSTNGNRSPLNNAYDEEIVVGQQLTARYIRETFRDILTNDSNESEEREDYSDLILYCLQTDYKKNKLSKLLKTKINSLSLPISLKVFLNYYRSK